MGGGALLEDGPIEDVVVLEPLADEQVAEELPQVPERTPSLPEPPEKLSLAT